jgi:hypothetical protein
MGQIDSTEVSRREEISRLEEAVRKLGRTIDTSVRVQLGVVVFVLLVVAFKWSTLDLAARTWAVSGFLLLQGIWMPLNLILSGRHRRALNELTALRLPERPPVHPGLP